MPGKGLDPSWEWGMNEAVAHHLSIGKEIVYTYGPYASIITRTYDPVTDRRMMWGSLFVVISYLIGLLYLGRGKTRYLSVIVLLFLATFGSPELLLLSYSFLLVACALKQFNAEGEGKPKALSWPQIIAVVVMWSTLGLLPLVKGSLLVPFAATAILSFALVGYHAHLKRALLLLLIPVASAVTLWVIAGQPLANLPAFLRGIKLLTSGYTEAMSTPWLLLPRIIGIGLVIAFIAASALLLFSISRATQLRAPSKWTLTLLSFVFLFVIFKHSFTHLDASQVAFPSLAVIALLVSFLHFDRYLVLALSVAMIFSAGTSVMHDPVLSNAVHEKFGQGITWGGRPREDVFRFSAARALEAYPRTTYQVTWRTYANAWQGLCARTSRGDDLKERFAKDLTDLRSDYALPALKGSTDVYEYEQSVLFASKNEWNPRPVFQGVMAYTPELLSLNEQHLRGGDAPDWVLFHLETIDGRLPSLDDGMSWPALLDNYKFASYDGRFLLLEKKEVIQAKSEYDDIYSGTSKTGATVTLPAADGLLFAEVDLKPTLAGKLLTTLFNPPQLRISVGLGNGTTRTYKVVANMMRTEFLLSPLVNDTEEFVSLTEKREQPQDGEKVRTIAITPSFGGSLFWSSSYDLKLKKYVEKQSSDGSS
jgi:hypothetical protein